MYSSIEFETGRVTPLCSCIFWKGLSARFERTRDGRNAFAEIERTLVWFGRLTFCFSVLWVIGSIGPNHFHFSVSKKKHVIHRAFCSFISIFGMCEAWPVFPCENKPIHSYQLASLVWNGPLFECDLNGWASPSEFVCKKVKSTEVFERSFLENMTIYAALKALWLMRDAPNLDAFKTGGRNPNCVDQALLLASRPASMDGIPTQLPSF